MEERVGRDSRLSLDALKRRRFVCAWHFSYVHNAQIEEFALFVARRIVVVVYCRALEITQFFIVPLLQHCFAISYRRENQRQYELKATTEAECIEWIDAIREAR